ncbi:MAG: tetraacyldisaccharide 4'-kinase [Bacteroidales bacterium]|nr:tetraacyldisaccharide 4'-kinase [Bacteroidales bacterium]
MPGKLQKILLSPFSILYGMVTGIRNWLFDKNILPSTQFDIPVISVGNITVGGTGKTPHVEYLIRLLKEEYKIAVLSRGYRRKTRNFNLVHKSSDVSTVGDEPLQIKRKHDDITLAVDRNRIKGVRGIISHEPGTEVILLDDAFQHRYIKPGLSILLADYKRPMHKDCLLPAGRLREHPSSINRADIVIITKSPAGLSAGERKIISEKLKLAPGKQLFFSGLSYEKPVKIFSEGEKGPEMKEISDKLSNVLLVTGIAQSRPLVTYLESHKLRISHLKYPDHHHYTKGDLKKISEMYHALPAGERCMITSEKDAVRMREGVSADDFPDDKLFYLRINIVFLNDEALEFNKYIFNYVRKNTGNS